MSDARSNLAPENASPLEQHHLPQLSLVLSHLRESQHKSTAFVVTIERLLNNSLEQASVETQDKMIEQFKLYVSEKITEDEFFAVTVGSGSVVVLKQLDIDSQRNLRELLSVATIKQMDEAHQLQLLAWIEYRANNWRVFSANTAFKNIMPAGVVGLAGAGFSALLTGPVLPIYVAANVLFQTGYQIKHRVTVKDRCAYMRHIFEQHFHPLVERYEQQKPKQATSSWLPTWFAAKKEKRDDEQALPLMTAAAGPAEAENASLRRRSWLGWPDSNEEQSVNSTEMTDPVTSPSIRLR